MAGVAEADAHARSGLEHLVVVHGLEQTLCLARVILCIERRLGLAAGPLGLARGPLGLHLLYMGGIQQHDVRQVCGGRRAVHGTAEAFLHQSGDPTGMVYVGMREKQEADAARVEGERCIVGRLFLLATLIQAAVHEEADPSHLHQIA